MLEDSKIKYEIDWTIKSRCKIYNLELNQCELCETEKKFIDMTDSEILLNENSQIKCMHKKRQK